MTTQAPTERTIDCPKCGHGSPWGARFCSQCGAWIVGVKPSIPPAQGSAVAAVAGGEAVHGTHRSPLFYFGVFVALGVLTVIELAITGISVIWFKFTALGVLAAIKFGLVIMFFMHLRGDRRLYGLVFLWPLLVALAIVLALGLLFHLI